MNSLSKAFAELRKNGLVARQNFTCCQSCGNYSGWEEVKGSKKMGLVFYHRQDKENLQKDRYVYLAYSGWDEPGKSTTKEVGNLVVETMKNNGLSVEWNGDVNTRIKVLLPT